MEQQSHGEPNSTPTPNIVARSSSGETLTQIGTRTVRLRTHAPCVCATPQACRYCADKQKQERQLNQQNTPFCCTSSKEARKHPGHACNRMLTTSSENPVDRPLEQAEDIARRLSEFAARADQLR